MPAGTIMSHIGTDTDGIQTKNVDGSFLNSKAIESSLAGRLTRTHEAIHAWQSCDHELARELKCNSTVVVARGR